MLHCLRTGMYIIAETALNVARLVKFPVYCPESLVSTVKTTYYKF